MLTVIEENVRNPLLFEPIQKSKLFLSFFMLVLRVIEIQQVQSHQWKCWVSYSYNNFKMDYWNITKL